MSLILIFGLTLLVVGITLLMRLGCKPGQVHYYGVPHPRSDDNPELIQTCYNCGRTRNVQVEKIGRGATGGARAHQAVLATDGVIRTHYACPCQCETRLFPMQKESLIDLQPTRITHNHVLQPTRVTHNHVN